MPSVLGLAKVMVTIVAVWADGGCEAGGVVQCALVWIGLMRTFIFGLGTVGLMGSMCLAVVLHMDVSCRSIFPL